MSNINIITESSSTGFFTKFLESCGSTKGMKGIFTIVLIAAILAVFELGFFYKIVAPTVEDEMNINIGKVGEQIAKNLNESNKEKQEKSPVADVAISRATKIVFNSTTGAVLDTTAAREKILVDTINDYTIYTGVAIVLVLSVSLYIIWKKIKNSVAAGSVSDDANMTDPIISAVITVGALIAFQIMFYFYGKQYRYPGTAGNEELMWVLIGSINPVGGNSTSDKNQSKVVINEPEV